MKKVLFITYVFPPVGGAGVQRTVKFLKYLPRHGWQGSVLTAANPSVPVMDHSLVNDVPRGTEVVRARTWEPGYSAKEVVSAGGGSDLACGGSSLLRALKRTARGLVKAVLQPDPQILWLPDAIRRGIRFLDGNPQSAIIASAPPFSVFAAGAVLARYAGIPLILDYRDEWDLSNRYYENKRLGAVSTAIQARMQEALVRRANALVATTAASAAALGLVRDRSRSGAHVTWVYNGFDESDLTAPARPPPVDGGRFRLVYTGTLWDLMSAGPLVRAIEHLARTNPAAAARLEIVFAGRRTAEQDEIIGSLRALPCTLTLKPYVDHDEALGLMRGADQLLVLLRDVPGAQRWVPAKIFEYMAARRPILAIAPNGEMTDLLKGYPAARIHHPADTAGIAAAIATDMNAAPTERAAALENWDASRYSREAQAGQLARLLDSAVRSESVALSRSAQFLETAASAG